MSAVDRPRYVVYDEDRHAPHNAPLIRTDGTTVLFAHDGECGRFDQLETAIQFAKSVWRAAEGRHTLIIRDAATHTREAVWTANAPPGP